MKKDIERIIVKYDDGTEKEISKGVIITLNKNENQDEEKMTFEFADIKRNELANILYGVIQMGNKIGLFGGGDEDEGRRAYR